MKAAGLAQAPNLHADDQLHVHLDVQILVWFSSQSGILCGG